MSSKLIFVFDKLDIVWLMNLIFVIKELDIVVDEIDNVIDQRDTYD